MNGNILKNLLSGAFLFSALVIPIRPASAATYIQSLDWATPEILVDQKSGNGLDYLLEYTLDEPLSNASILNAKLTLQHSGNSNIGPTNEIWHVLSGDGKFIGELSSSIAEVIIDTWLLSNAMLEDYLAEDASRWKFYLSEQTPFNGEKLLINHAALTLEINPMITDTLMIPEPSSGFFLMLGLLSAARVKKKWESKILNA